MIVSIVTPSYNQGAFLAETIESVLNQEGDFSIDYIVVDGGSSDNSVEIIRRYDTLLQRGEWPVRCGGISYRWTSEKDRGQTDALTKGFRQAKGDIFAWLNSDDTYLPGALESAVDFFRQHPDSGLVYGDADYCDSNGAIIGRYRTEEFCFDTLAWFNFICQPSSFFRKEAFEAVGGLNQTLQFAMDYDLWIRIAQRYPCVYLPRMLSRYRLHADSKTVRDETLAVNAEEALQLSLSHFRWAPLTKVYNACNPYCKARLPGWLAKHHSAILVMSVVCTVLRSIRLNHGIRTGDLKLLNRSNISKLFKSRPEIMTGKSQP